ncbi:MAG TPA: hypothetical protein VK196_08085, partial [Magnetospirillum sp.]|nr:hypothetical protein [Magnetospirillum sp.]
ENARARGRQPLARVTGATVGRWRPGTTLADMANRLEQHLLPRCGLDWPHVDLVSSGATGAGLPVDLQESALLRHLSDRSGHAPAVTACRALTGDAEAASSALQAAVAAEAVRGGTVLPTPGAALDTSLNVVVGNPALAVKRALVSALDPDGGFAFLGLAAA